MPSRSAISRMVSVLGPVTSRPLSVNVTVAASNCARSARVMAFIGYPSGNFVRKILHDAIHGVRRRLTQAANRGVAHHLRQIREQRLVPLVVRNQDVRLGGADAARRALAAGLM